MEIDKIIKTKILNVKLSVANFTPHRTTKGGKKILTSDPGLSLNLVLTIEKVLEIKSGQIVSDKHGTQYMYSDLTENAILRNVSMLHKSTIYIDQSVDLELVGVMRMCREGSYD